NIVPIRVNPRLSRFFDLRSFFPNLSRLNDPLQTRLIGFPCLVAVVVRLSEQSSPSRLRHNLGERFKGVRSQSPDTGHLADVLVPNTGVGFWVIDKADAV